MGRHSYHGGNADRASELNEMRGLCCHDGRKRKRGQRGRVSDGCHGSGRPFVYHDFKVMRRCEHADHSTQHALIRAFRYLPHPPPLLWVPLLREWQRLTPVWLPLWATPNPWFNCRDDCAAQVLSVGSDGVVSLQMGFMKLSVSADELDPLRR